MIRDTIDSAHVSINETLLSVAKSEREQAQAALLAFEVSEKRTRVKIRRGSTDIYQKLDRIHKTSRRSSISQTKSANLLAQKLDDINTKFASIVVISDNNTTERATIESFNLAAVTLPLMLIEADILKMLSTLVSDNHVTASQSDMDIFSCELTSLLSDCHLASARTERCTHIPHPSTKASQPHIKSVHDQGFATAPVDLERKRKFFFKETCAGLITMELETTWRYPGEEEVICGLYIAFIPSIQTIKNGILISFEKALKCSLRNDISRSIRLFNIIVDDTFLEHLFQRDDALELRQLLTKRTITPWDRTDFGYPLILVSSFQ